jgi:hypothetical protein
MNRFLSLVVVAGVALGVGGCGEKQEEKPKQAGKRRGTGALIDEVRRLW